MAMLYAGLTVDLTLAADAASAYPKHYFARQGLVLGAVLNLMLNMHAKDKCKYKMCDCSMQAIHQLMSMHN